jgi:hypothetical protein
MTMWTERAREMEPMEQLLMSILTWVDTSSKIKKDWRTPK